MKVATGEICERRPRKPELEAANCPTIRDSGPETILTELATAGLDPDLPRNLYSG